MQIVTENSLSPLSLVVNIIPYMLLFILKCANCLHLGGKFATALLPATLFGPQSETNVFLH